MTETSHENDCSATAGKGQGIEATQDQPNEAPDTLEKASDATDATAVVRFRIGGMLRFLSHAETLRVLERACIRAGIPIKYSQGFNPHAKLSLPLPRAVGVESDEELLAAKIFYCGGITLDEARPATDSEQATQMKEALAETLPDDITVHSVSLMKSNAAFRPGSAEYVFLVREKDRAKTIARVKDRVAAIQASESLVRERKKPNQREGRRIDLRPFLTSIRVEDPHIVVECSISNAGSIRVDEMLTLLDLTPEDLAGPIRRTNVTWTMT